MKILFTGKGTSGSWKVRGEQIAYGLRAIGVEALTVPKASVDLMRSADAVVLVKRPSAELLDAIRASGKPLVWDVVDAWPQPEGNAWEQRRALTWLHTMTADVHPNLLICPTRAMLDDAEYANSCVIYHHARPNLRPRRHEVHPNRSLLLNYDGGDYLGKLEQLITKQCNAPRFRYELFRFENGPLDSDTDVAICLRDTIGYAPRHWKSNVKLANAQALGIPALCSPESGYKETSTGGVLWIESPEDLPAAFDTLANPARYAELCAGVDAPPTLEDIAKQYVRELSRIC